MFGKALMGSLRGSLDRLHQIPRGKGFGEIRHAPCAQRSSARDVFIPPGDEYDRRRNSHVRQFALELNAANPIQVDVEHEARRFAQIRALDKAVDGRESLDVESTHFEQPLDGTQDAPVIIKNEYRLAQIHDALRPPLLVAGLR